MPRYKIPVVIETIATHVIGEVECDSLEEYEEKAEDLWKEQGWEHPGTFHDNKFDLGDWDFAKVTDEDLEFYNEYV